MECHFVGIAYIYIIYLEYNDSNCTLKNKIIIYVVYYMLYKTEPRTGMLFDFCFSFFKFAKCQQKLNFTTADFIY